MHQLTVTGVFLFGGLCGIVIGMILGIIIGFKIISNAMMKGFAQAVFSDPSVNLLARKISTQMILMQTILRNGPDEFERRDHG